MVHEEQHHMESGSSGRSRDAAPESWNKEQGRGEQGEMQQPALTERMCVRVSRRTSACTELSSVACESLWPAQVYYWYHEYDYHYYTHTHTHTHIHTHSFACE